eukprot:7341061-Pyramimonas_sp.AAC.1
MFFQKESVLGSKKGSQNILRGAHRQARTLRHGLISATSPPASRPGRLVSDGPAGPEDGPEGRRSTNTAGRQMIIR